MKDSLLLYRRLLGSARAGIRVGANRARHDPHVGAPCAEGERTPDASDQGDMEAGDGKYMHRPAFHEGLVDFVGEPGFPPERHGPEQAERFIRFRQPSG